MRFHRSTGQLVVTMYKTNYTARCITRCKLLNIFTAVESLYSALTTGSHEKCTFAPKDTMKQSC